MHIRPHNYDLVLAIRSHSSTNAWALRRVIPALQILLAVAAVGSLVLIATTEDLRLDWSSRGLKHALDLFAFPLSCVAALVAITGLDVAIDQLVESARQSAVAAWGSVMSSFLTFARDQSPVPFSAFNPASFPPTLQGSGTSDTMFAVEIPVPTVTLHRLLDPGSLGAVNQFSLQKELEGQLRKLDQTFTQLRERAARGDQTWIGSFVDLGILVRQVRQHLLVQTARMSGWDHQPVLEEMTELGKKRICPAYSSSKFPDICSDIRVELLCIAKVLLFERSGQQHAAGMKDIAHRVGQIWRNADQEKLMHVLMSTDLDELWREPHRLMARSIEI